MITITLQNGDKLYIVEFRARSENILVVPKNQVPNNAVIIGELDAEGNEINGD